MNSCWILSQLKTTLTMIMKYWFLQTTLCLHVSLLLGLNPCDPNPCGKNTRCWSSPSQQPGPPCQQNTISCKCLEGINYSQIYIGSKVETENILDFGLCEWWYNIICVCIFMKNRISVGRPIRRMCWWCFISQCSDNYKEKNYNKLQPEPFTTCQLKLQNYKLQLLGIQ